MKHGIAAYHNYSRKSLSILTAACLALFLWYLIGWIMSGDNGGWRPIVTMLYFVAFCFIETGRHIVYAIYYTADMREHTRDESFQ